MKCLILLEMIILGHQNIYPMNTITPLLFAAFFMLLSGCGKTASHLSQDDPQEDPPPPPPRGTINFNSQTFSKKAGCENEEAKCLEITFTYPEANSGNSAIQDSLNAFIQQYLSGLLSMDEGMGGTLEEQADRAAADFKEFITEFPDDFGQWAYECNGDVILNNGNLVSLSFSEYSFTGGAHPNSSTTLATFDAATGKRLTLEDLVEDMEKLNRLGEQYFREARELGPEEDLAELGFDFPDGNFFLPADNFAKTTDGILFIFNPYTVGPYVMGPTEFEIPDSESGL
jgi:hypothetical protein